MLLARRAKLLSHASNSGHTGPRRVQGSSKPAFHIPACRSGQCDGSHRMIDSISASTREGAPRGTDRPLCQVSCDRHASQRSTRAGESESYQLRVPRCFWAPLGNTGSDLSYCLIPISHERRCHRYAVRPEMSDRGVRHRESYDRRGRALDLGRGY